jgi:hypothetical protein
MFSTQPHQFNFTFENYFFLVFVDGTMQVYSPFFSSFFFFLFFWVFLTIADLVSQTIDLPRLSSQVEQYLDDHW